MLELKEAALNRPQDFYERGVLGEPAVVYPFVVCLHTLKDDFKETIQQCLNIEGSPTLFDWWDVLLSLKKGLLQSAELQQQKGQPVLNQLKEIYESEDFVVSTVEEGVECEFQWLLCQQYSFRTMTLLEAWERWNRMQASASASNEYSGENALHVLIVQGGTADVYISKLFSIVTMQRYRMSLLCAEVGGA
jgi:hypothetical protein